MICFGGSVVITGVNTPLFIKVPNAMPFTEWDSKR